MKLRHRNSNKFLTPHARRGTSAFTAGSALLTMVAVGIVGLAVLPKLGSSYSQSIANQTSAKGEALHRAERVTPLLASRSEAGLLSTLRNAARTRRVQTAGLRGLQQAGRAMASIDEPVLLIRGVPEFVPPVSKRYANLELIRLAASAQTGAELEGLPPSYVALLKRAARLTSSDTHPETLRHMERMASAAVSANVQETRRLSELLKNGAFRNLFGMRELTDEFVSYAESFQRGEVPPSLARRFSTTEPQLPITSVYFGGDEADLAVARALEALRAAPPENPYTRAEAVALLGRDGAWRDVLVSTLEEVRAELGEARFSRAADEFISDATAEGHFFWPHGSGDSKAIQAAYFPAVADKKITLTILDEIVPEGIISEALAEKIRALTSRFTPAR